MNYEELKRRADAGDPVSQEEYATACYNGYVKGPLFHNMKKDAFEYYQKAANLGHREAQFKLASMYFLGEGGAKKDFDKHLFWVCCAYEMGHKGATDWLNRMLDQGIRREIIEKVIEDIEKNHKNLISGYRRPKV